MQYPSLQLVLVQVLMPRTTILGGGGAARDHQTEAGQAKPVLDDAFHAMDLVAAQALSKRCLRAARHDAPASSGW